MPLVRSSVITPATASSAANCDAAGAANPAPHDRTTRAAKSAAVALVQAVASMVLGVVSVPILVRSLGQETYGMWLLLGQLATYLALIDFGNASIAKLKLASKNGPDSALERQEVLTSTLLGVLVSTPFVAAIGVAMVIWASLHFSDATLTPFEITVTAGLLVASFLVFRLASIPAFALFGANLEYRSAIVRAVATVCNGFLDIAAAFAGFGMVGLACNRLLGSLVSGWILQTSARRDVSWYRFGRFQWMKLRPLLKQNTLCLFAQWGYTLAEAVDVLIIGLAVGAEAVPVYTITAALPKLMFMLFYQAMSGANAGLVGLFGHGNRERFHFVRTQQEIISIACLAVVGAVTLAVNRDFVTAWVGRQYFGGTTLTMLGIAWFFLMIMSRQYCNALNAALDFKHMAIVQVVAGLVSLAAGFVGASLNGANGAIAGLVAVRLAANAFNSVRVDRLLGVSSFQHVSSLLLPSMVATACCFAGWCTSHAELPNGWLGTVAVSAVVSATAAGVVWFVGLPQPSKADVIARLSHIRNSFLRRAASTPR